MDFPGKLRHRVPCRAGEIWDALGSCQPGRSWAPGPQITLITGSDNVQNQSQRGRSTTEQVLGPARSRAPRNDGEERRCGAGRGCCWLPFCPCSFPALDSLCGVERCLHPPNISCQLRNERKARPEDERGGRTRPCLGSTATLPVFGGDGGRGKPHAANVLKVNEIK